MMPSALLLLVSLLVMMPSLAAAQMQPGSARLPEVVITGERLPRLDEAASQFLITPEDIQLLPPARPGNILRVVPGFVTIDHSGGGVKADQYLFRGFDADHGTDVAFFMDGMPINIRSHAHGQGYADLAIAVRMKVPSVRRAKPATISSTGKPTSSSGRGSAPSSSSITAPAFIATMRARSSATRASIHCPALEATRSFFGRASSSASSSRPRSGCSTWIRSWYSSGMKALPKPATPRGAWASSSAPGSNPSTG